MASDEEIKTLAVKIALDASSFTQQAAAFKKQVTALDSGFKASVAGIKDWGTQSGHLKDQVSALGSQIDVQKQVVSSYQGQITKTSAALEAHSKQVVENREKVAQLKSAYEQSASTLGKNADETKALKKQLDDAEQSLSKSENQVRRNQSAIDGYNIQLNNATGKLNTMEAALKDANSALFDHTNLLARAGTALQKAGDKITTAGGKISDVGQTLTMGVTAPIVGVGVAAEKTGLDFEAQMSRVQAIAGATGDQLKTLTQTAMDLGQKTTYSDQEVAQGMENMASAGFSVNEITAAMPGMLNLAASSGEDLASSADIAASTLRGFGLAADQAGHVADVLAKNAAQTNAAVADTGLAMQYIAPLAQNAGWSIESVTAAIGEMADKGIKGEKAGTALRGALTNLINPSTAQAAAMKEIGLQVYNASGKMNSLSNIIGQLQKGTAKMTNAQRDQAIATIVGTDALSGMQALISDGSGALDAMTASLKDSDGAAQDMANTMLNNTKGSIEQMKGSVENAGIALSKSLSPSVKEAADKVTDLANKFAKLPSSTQSNIVKFAALAAVVGPVTLGIGKLTDGVGKSITALGKGVKGVADFAKGVSGLAPATLEGASAALKLGSALSGLGAGGVVGLAVLGIGAIAAVVATISANAKEAHSRVNTLISSLSDENKSYQDLVATQQKTQDANLAEVNHVENLYNTLKKLTDQNGIIIGDKEEAKIAIDEINKMFPGSIALVDGERVAYEKDDAAIKNLIATKKAQIILDSKEELYKQAVANVTKKSTEQAGVYNDMQQKSIELQDLMTRADELGTNASKELGAGWQKKAQSLRDAIAKDQASYDESDTVIKGYYSAINSYESLSAAITSGDQTKIQQAIENTTLKYTASTGATKEQLQQQYQDADSMLTLTKQRYEQHWAGVTQDTVNEAESLRDKAYAEYKLVGEDSGTGLKNGIDSKSGEVASAGSNLANQAQSGFSSADFYSAGAKAANAIASAFRSFNATVAGETIGQQIINGINSKTKYFRIEMSGGVTGYKSSGGMTITPYATGTDYFRGGLAYINEKGGEIVNLPTGAQIIPHDVSMEIAKAVGQAVGSNIRGSQSDGINVHADQIVVNNPQDLKRALWQERWLNQ